VTPAAACFQPDGPLSRVLPGYEHRPQQLEMARQVELALSDRGRLAIEAGTGVGKSLAYLVPAALWAKQSGKRVTVSTYTRILQSQLITKDVPLAAGLLDSAPRVAVAYGQGNYLCRFRIETQLARGLFDSRADASAAGRLFNWADTTETGVLLDYPHPLPAAVARRVARDSVACRRELCPYRKACFYYRAKREWSDAQLLIVNHALFFASVTGAGDLLPEPDAVIFDEAHRLEEACVRHFGADLSQRSVAELLDDVLGPGRGGLARMLGARTRLRKDVEAATNESREATSRFFTDTVARLPGPGRTRLREALPAAEATSALTRLADAMEKAAPEIKDELAATEFAVAVHRLRATTGAFAAFSDFATENSVYWAEQPAGDNLCLFAAPLNVTPMLRAHVYDLGIPVILTSATLTVAGNFGFFSERLGLDDFSQIRLDSPFDYGSQSLVFVPPRLPAPTAGDEFTRAAAGAIAAIIHESKGRALVLFTSYESVNAVCDLVPPAGYNFLRQGDLPLPKLLAAFQEDRHSVLFATQSFWQGIDVPGEALSCLIICRLPFEVPDDPRLSAIAERMKQNGLEPFTAYQLPTAVLRFRQGFGRLIRTAQDRGVVCVLDRRIVDRPYGRVFLNSLPKGLRLTTNLADIDRFFQDAE